MTLSGEDFLNGSPHAKRTLEAFHEVAPDRTVEYKQLAQGDRLDEIANSGADSMFVSLSTQNYGYSDAKNFDQKIPNNLFLCVAAGNDGTTQYNTFMLPQKIYGVGAVEYAWSASINGEPCDGAKLMILPAGYSGESEYVDFASFTNLYLTSNGDRPFPGTSCACPVLVGLAALVNDFFIDRTGEPLTHSAMYRFLKDCSEDNTTYGIGKDDKTGWGIPRLPPPDAVDISKYSNKVKKMDIIDTGLKWVYNPGIRTKTTEYLVIHHAAAQTCSVEDIHRIHIGNGWAGIGYNYFVRKDGSVYKGRPEEWKNGHTYGYSENSLGICFEGDFEVEKMTDAQVNAGANLVYDILNRYPGIQVVKHSKLSATSCPGVNFRFDEVSSGMGTYEMFKQYMSQYEREIALKSEPDWSKKEGTWTKATEKSIVDGTRPEGYVKRDEMVAILGRCGIIK